jgi:[acyl-carrier-protein] S-malonyltransferase
VTPSPAVPAVAATVGGEPVWAAEVDAEVDRLRAGPQARRLPGPDTGDGRQLRRWVTQRVVLRRLLEREAADRALTDGAEPGEDDCAPRLHKNGRGGRFNETAPDPAILGAATADVLATSPAARAVYADVTSDEAVTDTDLLAYYRRNLDRYTRRECWTIRLATSRPGLDTTTAVPVDPTALPPATRAALAAAGPGPAVAIAAAPDGVGTYAALEAVRPGGVRPYDEVRDEVAAVVLGRRRQVAFARWLDARAAAVITLSPGYEHPADPGNPDATHRH